MNQPDELLAVVADRTEFMTLLREEGPLRTREIVDSVRHSRSTVTRVLRELQEAELVEKTDDGYAATRFGAVATDEYQRYEERMTTLVETQDVLDALPDSVDLPTELLREADVFQFEGEQRFRLVDLVIERLRNAANIGTYLPVLTSMRILRTLADRAGSLDGSCRVVFDSELIESLKGRYPQLLSEIAQGEPVSVHSGEERPYAVIVADDGERTSVVLIFYGESMMPQVGLVIETETASEWAESRLAKVHDAGTDLTDDLASLSVVAGNGPNDSFVTESGSVAIDGNAVGVLPLALRMEGFVRLSEEYFETHRTAPPETSWQTGFTLTEVHAGHAVERRYPNGQAGTVTAHLISQLRAGDDHVVLGPPGAGKSTTCMSVACEWFDRGYGPVLYRERGIGEQLESTALLEAYLRQTEGHALVVLEDTTRKQAKGVFSVMRALEGDETVTFLLDARTNEWNDPQALSTEPQLDAYRHDSVETFTLPDLDGQEYERFARQFESCVDTSVELSGERLQEVVTAEQQAIGSESPAPGKALLVQYHLAGHVDPLEPENSPVQTGLEGEIRRLCDDVLTETAELTAELAVLVNALNAAGVSVAREYCYALVDEDDYAELEAALDRLDGQVLFGREEAGSGATTYRTYQETWSVLFLRQLREVTQPARANRLFGNVLSALLSISDDSTRRRSIGQHITEQTPHLNRVETDPTGWADALVERLFQLGRRYPELASLFGTTADNHIDIPNACSEAVTCRQANWRAYMYDRCGLPDRATDEASALLRMIESRDLSAKQRAELRWWGKKLQVTISIRQGEYDRAETLVDELLSDRDTDETPLWEMRHSLLRARLLYFKNEFEDAEPHFETAVERAKEYDHPKIMTVALAGLGSTKRRLGMDDNIEEIYREAIEAAKRAGDTSNELVARNNLGVLLRDKGEYDEATTLFAENCSRARHRGISIREANALCNLGLTALRRGMLAEAREYSERALELYQEREEPGRIGRVRKLQAGVALLEGDIDEAARVADEAREQFEVADDSHGIATARRVEARVALLDGRPVDARHALATAERIHERHSIQADRGDLGLALVDILLDEGRLDEAREALGATEREFDRLENETGQARVACRRGWIQLASNEPEGAAERFEDARDVGEKRTDYRLLLRAHRGLAWAAAVENESQRVRTHLDQLEAICTDTGIDDERFRSSPLSETCLGPETVRLPTEF